MISNNKVECKLYAFSIFRILFMKLYAFKIYTMIYLDIMHYIVQHN